MLMSTLVAANQAQDCPDASKPEHRKAGAQVSGRVTLHPWQERTPSNPPGDPNWRRLTELTREARRYAAEGNVPMAIEFKRAAHNLRSVIRLRTAQEFARVIDAGPGAA